MKNQIKRVEWTENRSVEIYFIIAEKTDTGWQFFEKSSFDVLWYPLSSTPKLIEFAELEEAKCTL